MRIILVLFAYLMGIGYSHAVNLREAVRMAVETNPRIEAAEASYRATQRALEQARGRFLPEVDFSGDLGWQKINRPEGLGPFINNVRRERRQGTISVRQVLFDGWDRANDVYRSQARISSASQRILARSEAVALSAIEAYIDIERHANLMKLSRNHVRRHEKLLKIIQERVDGGKSPISDFEQTVERLEAAKALVAQIEIALASANAKYKNAVGAKPTKLVPVRYATGIPATSAAVVDIALSNNPNIRALESDTDAADFEKEQFKSSFYPQLFFEGSATSGEDLEGTPNRNDDLKALFVLRWRLLDGGIRRNREGELAERASESRAEQQILARDLTEEIEISWARLTKGRAEVVSLKKQVAQTKKVVAAYKNEYDADKRSLLDVLDAENARFAGEFEYQNTLSLHMFSSYQLLANMGRILEELGIEQPINDLQPLNLPQV